MYPTLSAALATVRRIAKSHGLRLVIEVGDDGDEEVFALDMDRPYGHRIVASAKAADGGTTIDEAVEAVARQIEALAAA